MTVHFSPSLLLSNNYQLAARLRCFRSCAIVAILSPHVSTPMLMCAPISNLNHHDRRSLFRYFVLFEFIPASCYPHITSHSSHLYPFVSGFSVFSKTAYLLSSSPCCHFILGLSVLPLSLHLACSSVNYAKSNILLTSAFFHSYIADSLRMIVLHPGF